MTLFWWNSRKSRQLLIRWGLAAGFLVVATLLVVTMERQFSQLSPENTRHELSAQDKVKELPRWHIALRECPLGGECLPVEQVFEETLPLSTQAIAGFSEGRKGRVEAIATHRLTAAEKAWLLRHTYAALTLPRNVQNSTTLEFGEAVLTSVGNGANAHFLFESQDLVRAETLKLTFDCSGLPTFGPLDVPPALADPVAAATYESLPVRQTAAAALVSQMSLSIRFTIATLALVLDHSLAFATLSLFAVLRSLRAALPLFVESGSTHIAAWTFALAFLSTLVSSAFVLFILEICQLRTKLARWWIHGSLALMTIAFLQAWFDSNAWMRIEITTDITAQFTAVGLIAYSLALTWRQHHHEPEPEWIRHHEVLQVVVLRKSLILAAIALKTWADVDDLLLVSSGGFKGTFDLRHSLFFPAITLAGLLEVGFISRKVEAVKKEIAEKIRLDEEVALARTHQQTTLPPLKHQGAHWVWRAYYHPARHLGGDWFDVREILLSDQTVVLAACLVDVTGHGLESALSTTVAASAWGSWCQEIAELPTGAADWPTLLSHAPKRLHGALSASRRKAGATGVFVIICGGQLHICTAGHPGAYLCRSDSLDSLAMTNPALGGGREADGFQVASRALAPSDTLLLFSDGLVPLDEGIQRWTGALRRALRRQEKRLETLLAERVRATRRSYRMAPAEEDDISLVALTAANAPP